MVIVYKIPDFNNISRLEYCLLHSHILYVDSIGTVQIKDTAYAVF